MKKASSFVVAVVVSMICGAAAWADVAPRDACTSPGQPCQVAGPSFDQPGTCQTTTCTKSLPNGDGGFTTMMYSCNLCLGGAGGAGGGAGNGATGGGPAGGAAGSAAGGAGGSTAAGGAGGFAGSAAGTGGTSTGAGGQTTGGGSKSSGCAVAGGGAGLNATALLLLAMLFLRRRPAR